MEDLCYQSSDTFIEIHLSYISIFACPEGVDFDMSITILFPHNCLSRPVIWKDNHLFVNTFCTSFVNPNCHFSLIHHPNQIVKSRYQFQPNLHLQTPANKNRGIVNAINFAQLFKPISVDAYCIQLKMYRMRISASPPFFGGCHLTAGVHTGLQTKDI